MGKITGVKKEKITISISHSNLKNITDAIERGEFSNVSEAINAWLTSYYNIQNDLGQSVKDYLESPKGELLFKTLFEKYQKSISED